VPRGQSDGSLRPYSRFSRQEPQLFHKTGLCDEISCILPPSRDITDKPVLSLQSRVEFVCIPAFYVFRNYKHFGAQAAVSEHVVRFFIECLLLVLRVVIF
jgi:hypothetical protein